jgi:FKBP-type peptidyl-prolyl cis-trans isomerase
MCVGEKRTLTIPSDMAYGVYNLSVYYHLALTLLISGPRGFGSVIPPNSALVFDVELVGLTSKPAHQEL